MITRIIVRALKWLVIVGSLGTAISTIGGIGSDIFGSSFFDWVEYVDEDGYTQNFHLADKIAFFITIGELVIYRIKGLKLADLFESIYY